MQSAKHNAPKKKKKIEKQRKNTNNNNTKIQTKEGKKLLYILRAKKWTN